MQRFEEKSDPIKKVRQLMEEHVIYLWSRPRVEAGWTYLRIHFADKKPAQQIIAELRKTSGFNSFFYKTAEVKSDECGHYLLELDKRGIEKIWGKGSYDSFCAVSNLFIDSSYSRLWEILLKVSAEDPAHYQMLLRNAAGGDVSVFERILRYAPLRVCFKLIDQMSVATVNQMLGLADYDWCAMMTAAWFQSEENFIALIKKASPVALAHAVCVLPRYDKRRYAAPASSIEIACQYQSSAAVHNLLQLLSSPPAKTIINKFYQQHPEKILSTFILLALYQSVENCRDFLALLDTKLIATLIETICNKVHSYRIRSALRALLYKLEQSEHKIEDVGQLPVMTFITAKTADASPVVTPEELLAKCLKPLQQYDKEKSVEEKKLSFCSVREEKALHQFKQGVFVKIVRDEGRSDNKDFITHLFYPGQRQLVRDTKGFDKRGYKLILNPQSDGKEEKSSFFPRIVYARTYEERLQHKKKKPPHTLSTKHPVTYVSKKLHTGLFGYHADREMVGYAFKVNPKNIKLLSTEDCGTYRRWWYGSSESELRAEANHALHIICQSFDEFVKRVDQQPFVVNEALVKLHRNDLFAIVIGRDTPKAREIALKRRLELLRDHKVDLPILFYHPEFEPRVYTSAQQRADHPVLWLESLQTIIWQQHGVSGYVKGFFGRSSEKDAIHVEVDGQEYELTTVEANQILAIIKANAKTPELAVLLLLSVILNKANDRLPISKIRHII